MVDKRSKYPQTWDGKPLRWSLPDGRGIIHAELRAKNLGPLSYGRLTDDFIDLWYHLARGLIAVTAGGNMHEFPSWDQAEQFVREWVERRRDDLKKTLSQPSTADLKRKHWDTVMTATIGPKF